MKKLSALYKRIAILTLAIIIFIIANVVLCGLAIVKNLSLIPLIGLSSCLYLLTGMSHENWFWFGLWFAIGLIIYFLYGYKNSKLNKEIKTIDS